MRYAGAVWYSEAFKRKVIRELESGRFRSMSAARRAYDIRGAQTLQNWIRHYGKDSLLGKVVYVKDRNELDDMKALKQRIRELERGLADAHMRLILEEEYTKMACEVAGIEDVEAFKKKERARPSAG